MPATFDFSNKVVLVTGSSRGIGAGLIQAFAAAGAKCVVNYVSDPAGRNKAEAETLPNALVVEGDVADDGQVARMMGEIKSKLGGLDVLVNNAGILRDRTIKKMSLDDWNAVMQVNLTGPFNCLRHGASLLRDDGRVVNISSLSAYAGLFGQANYASAKAGLVGLTKVAARELAKQRITVNAVAPGVIETEIIQNIPPDVRARYVEQIPLSRLGQVEDVVSAVLFLCSKHASYITGQVLHVNGGMLMP